MREYIRSRPYTWSSGARIPVDLSFLEATLAKYRSPVIEEIQLRVTGSVSTLGAFTLENFDHAAIVASSFLWRDKRGERINLTGREIRLAAQMEYGSRFQDPADQAGTTTNTSFECILPITFHPQRARRRADFRPSVAEMISGEVIWTAAGTNPITASTQINSLTMEMHAIVSDEVVPEAASRLCWLSVNAPLAEDNLTVDGALRHAALYAYNTGSDLTSLSSYTELTSYTLDMVTVPRTVIKSLYSRETVDFDATNDEVGRDRVIPLVYPNADQKITGMRDVNKLHYRLQAALPTGGRLVYCTITDRDPVLTAAALQVPVMDVAATPKKVSGTKGGKNVAAFGAGARKLPIRRA